MTTSSQWVASRRTAVEMSPPRLSGAPGPDRSHQADAVLPGDLLLDGDGEIAAVEEVLLRQRVPIIEVGQDAGEGLGVVDGSLGGADVGDHAGGVRIAGFGDMREEALPAGLAAACVAGALAPLRTVLTIKVVVLHEDLAQGLDLLTVAKGGQVASVRTLWWKPGSSSSLPRAYFGFQDPRQRQLLSLFQHGPGDGWLRHKCPAVEQIFPVRSASGGM
ncbi:hypothetical protein [Streptomyces sp. NBC_01716]|uniref:hypothetical protein n=1 Tax=Streptomyces sp. NBC_01716 TaxID=2975917 RepID=UPI002E337847|nr:hypothetical protein [Streptomyces sp. NBC_01716]